MMKNLLFVQPKDILQVMGFVNKYVKPAYATGIGEREWETLIGQMLLGQVILWLAFDNGTVVGAATTEVIDYTGYRSVHIITSGTDNGAGFQDYHPFLEDYARSIKAKRIQFWGRKGWSRAVTKITGKHNEKYDEVYRVFSMEITNNEDDSTPESGHEAYELVGDGSTEG